MRKIMILNNQIIYSEMIMRHEIEREKKNFE